MLLRPKKKENSAKKLEYLYNKYCKLLYVIAYDVLNDASMAEDVVHETFVRLIGKTDRIKDLDSAATRNFLAVICKNIAINVYNRRKKENESAYAENDLMPLVSDTYNPEKIVISKESMNSIKDSMYSLDEKYRDVFILARVFEIPNNEVAKTIGLTTETVKKRLQRAKIKIAADLAEKENQNAQ